MDICWYQVDLNDNHEMTVGGVATILSALLAGMPSYGQACAATCP